LLLHLRAKQPKNQLRRFEPGVVIGPGVNKHAYREEGLCCKNHIGARAAPIKAIRKSVLYGETEQPFDQVKLLFDVIAGYPPYLALAHHVYRLISIDCRAGPTAARLRSSNSGAETTIRPAGTVKLICSCCP
jgi:hypothetical protein